MDFPWKYSSEKYWPFNGMVNDLYRGVQAEENYLVALGLLAYSEAIGGLLIDLRVMGDGCKCFRAFTEKYVGYKFNHWGQLHDDIRNGLAHQYFIKNRLGVVLNDPGDRPSGISENAAGIEIYINTYFQHFVRGLEKFLDEKFAQ